MLSTDSNPDDSTGYSKATFAGGCFWCMQPPFDQLEGVVSVAVGYTGGNTSNPTYSEICSGNTGHAEAIQIIFDPHKITYLELLDVFWRQINPTDKEGQFLDRGDQYRTAIFYHDEEQRSLAEESRQAIQKSGRFKDKIITEIVKASTFYLAENYHQNYYKTNPHHYRRYSIGSGRNQYLKKMWGKDLKEATETASGNLFIKPPLKELKKTLTPEQYYVTQEEGTETPFRNKFWDSKREGIYVDIVSGEPLFSSKDKFDSGTGWPSFSKPIKNTSLIEKEDRTLISVRTEVRSKLAGSHLGHLFPDGPAPKGLRYCINSAALRFIPKNELKQEGYGKYLEIF